MNYYRANYHADDYAWRGGRCAVERAWLAPLLPRLAQLDVERLMLGRLPDRHVDAGGAPAAEAPADEGGGGSGGGDPQGAGAAAAREAVVAAARERFRQRQKRKRCE